MSLAFSWRKLFSILFLAAAIPFLSCTPKIAPPSHKTLPEANIDQQILDYVNEYRQSKGLTALQFNPAITEQAEMHSFNMANKKTPFGHDGFEDRVKVITQKIGPVHQSAENVAYGKIDARQVVDIWLKSPGHRHNIEGNYSLTGIGVVKSNDGNLFFTQIFATK